MPALETALDLAEPVALVVLFLAFVASLVGCVAFALEIVGVM